MKHAVTITILFALIWVAVIGSAVAMVVAR